MLYFQLFLTALNLFDQLLLFLLIGKSVFSHLINSDLQLRDSHVLEVVVRVFVVQGSNQFLKLLFLSFNINIVCL